MTAKLVREKLIEIAPGIIETADKLARGKLKDYEGDRGVLQAMLRLVSPVIDLKDDAVQMGEMKAEITLSDRVNAIQNAMFGGAISLAQAQMMVETLAKSYDAIDAQELKEALQKLANAT